MYLERGNTRHLVTNTVGVRIHDLGELTNGVLALVRRKYVNTGLTAASAMVPTGNAGAVNAEVDYCGAS